MLELRYYGDPVLRRHTSPVKRFDRDLAQLARDMLDTMVALRGIGLAAPQVGVLRQLIVVDVSEDQNEPEVLVNPRIVGRAGEESESEGCLSLPGVRVEVKRAREIEVRFQDVQGKEHVVRGDDLWARVVQHEMDHLEGHLIVDDLGRDERSRFEEEWPGMLSQAQATQPGREGAGPALAGFPVLSRKRDL